MSNTNIKILNDLRKIRTIFHKIILEFYSSIFWPFLVIGGNLIMLVGVWRCFSFNSIILEIFVLIFYWVNFLHLSRAINFDSKFDRHQRNHIIVSLIDITYVISKAITPAETEP